MENLIENKICKMFDIEMETDDYRIKWAGNAIAIYIHTKATTQFAKAFIHSNLKKLLEYMITGNDMSDDTIIARANEYFIKHRKYAK